MLPMVNKYKAPTEEEMELRNQSIMDSIKSTNEIIKPVYLTHIGLDYFVTPTLITKLEYMLGSKELLSFAGISNVGGIIFLDSKKYNTLVRETEEESWVLFAELYMGDGIYPYRSITKDIRQIALKHFINYYPEKIIADGVEIYEEKMNIKKENK